VVSAKSQVLNILPASPCGSRFCGEPGGIFRSKSFNINILHVMIRKNSPLPQCVEGADAANTKSFVWNILQVSPCGSIFCGEAMRSDSSNPPIFQYFTEMYRKICGRSPHANFHVFKILPAKS
jgi:hypothetical protein